MFVLVIPEEKILTRQIIELPFSEFGYWYRMMVIIVYGIIEARKFPVIQRLTALWGRLHQKIHERPANTVHWARPD